MRDLNVVFVLGVLLVIAPAVYQVQVTGKVCEVVNASERLDEFEQSWHVHCIGTVEEPPILGWSVEGELVCVALLCPPSLWPAPPKVEGVYGFDRIMEVSFTGTCQWCPFLYLDYLSEGPPPAGAICKCCSGYWPCKDGVIAPFPEIKTSWLPPKLYVQKHHSITHDTDLVITIYASDKEGDLRGVYWTNPKHGRLFPRPSPIEPSYEWETTLTYRPDPCWTGHDSFTV